ncbi:MAG: hypothetical protein ACRCX2_19695 [Paraclostridium sp.]
MLEDERLARQGIVDANEYDDGTTIGRSATRMFVLDPLLESSIINAYSKNNHAAEKFASALKTKVYNNNTFMTGTSLGDTWGKLFKIKETKDLAGSTFKKNWTFNFVKQDGLGTLTGLSDDISENVVRSGIGFSRNNSKLFNVLDDLSYTVQKMERKSGGSIFKKVDSYYQGVSDGIPLEIFGRYSKMSDIKNFLDGTDISGKAISGKYTFSTVDQGLSYGIDMNVFKKNTPLDVIKKVVETGEMDLKYLNKNATVEQLSTLNRHYKNVASSVDNIASTGSALKSETQTLFDFFKVGKVDEGFELMKKTLSSDPANLIKAQRAAQAAGIKTTVNTTAEIAANPSLLREGAEELSGLIRDKYFKSTAFEKFMGSDTLKFLTGAGTEKPLFHIGKIPISAGTIANVGLAAVSAISATHQESMIQSATNISTFNLIKGEDVLNSRGSESMYSNRQRSMSNDQDLNYVLRTANNAEQYRRDSSPLNIDRSKSSKSNFTLY